MRGNRRDHVGGGGRESPVFVIDGTTDWRRWWADLWMYRGALWSLAWRNVRSRYKQAALGAAWALLQPAVQVGVLTVLFGVLARIPSGGLPYPVVALSGLLVWNLFARIVADAAASLVANQHLITKLFFPRLYLVLAVGASPLIDAAVALVLLGVLMAVYGVAAGPHALLAVPVLAGVVVFAYGLGALLAAVNARWRDVQHTLPLLLQVGLFVTPVIYQHTLLPDRWRWVLALNPMAGLVELFRASVLGTPVPAAQLLLVSLGVGIVCVVGGVWYFTRAEAELVDVV